MRATINGMFSGVWADDNFGTSTTLRIQSKAPSWTFTGLAVSEPHSVTLTLDDQNGHAGNRGRLGDGRFRLAGHDRGRAPVDSRLGRTIPDKRHQGILCLLDGVL
jgi:hypothetical protein